MRLFVSRAEGGLAPDIIGVVANQDWMKKNYDLLEKFSVGTAQAAQFIRKNPRKAAEIDTSYIDGMNVADASRDSSLCTGIHAFRFVPLRAWSAPATT